MRRPSPGRILAAVRPRLAAVRARLAAIRPRLAAVRPRLAGARYAIQDGAYVTGRFLRRLPPALRRGAEAFWGGLGQHARRRLVAALGAGVALTLFLGLAVPSLPCQLPGGERCPPPDDAEGLVPADALAYVHANLDPDGEQYAEAAEVVASLPTISGRIVADALAQLPGPAGAPPDFTRDIDPWFGEQAALAAIPARRGAERVGLLEVDDSDGAAAFAREVAAGRPRVEEYRGVEVRADRGGVATAQIEDFLAIGSRSGVRSVIDVATGAEGSTSIADDPTADDLRDQLPTHRLAEAYLSREGAEELVARGTGVLASLAPFVSPQATRGVAAALSVEDRELELTVRSALDPDRGRAEPGFFAAFAPFEPELPALLPADSLAYVGFGDPQGTVEALLAQATAGAPGIASGFEGLVRELRRDGEIDIERQLLPALGDEAAFVLEPRAEAAEGAGEPAPFLQFVARGVDEDQARNALARLQRPVADAIEPAIGLQAPVFRDLEVAGVETRTLRVSPAIELSHAIFDDLAVIATDPVGIERLAEGDDGLDDAERFERATEGFPDAVSLLAFLDLGQLVLVAERLGLGADPVYAAFAAEVRTLSGLGLAVRLDGDLLATDLRLIVEPPGEQGEQEEVPLPPPEPEPAPEPELPPDTPGFEPPPAPPAPELAPELQP